MKSEKNTKLNEVVYGICESLSYPCFVRLVYNVKGVYKIQVQHKDKVHLESINLDTNITKYLKFSQRLKLDSEKLNFGLALDSKNIICGTKKEIADAFGFKIKYCDPYFQVEYFDFLDDPFNLIIAYHNLKNYPGASNKTRMWAANEGKRLEELIDDTFGQFIKSKKQYKQLMYGWKTPLHEKKSSYLLPTKDYSVANLTHAKKETITKAIENSILKNVSQNDRRLVLTVLKKHFIVID